MGCRARAHRAPPPRAHAEGGTWNCEVAHIYGVRRTAARGEHDQTDEQLREASNLVLMCPNHHTEIDNKALEGTYTVARVQQMKEEHESRFRRALVSLERIVDGTAGVVVKRPENMRALPGFDNMDEEETRDNLGAATPFVDGLSRLPLSLRDVITLILVHGRASRTRGRFGGQQVAVSAARMEGVAQIHVDDFRHRARTTSRSSTTNAVTTQRSATAPRAKHGPTTTPSPARPSPQRPDQRKNTRNCPQSLTQPTLRNRGCRDRS
ncbi:HNH endonuclease [Brevibacterium luteolum]|uniref:HNH endonuclease n=1 Tax=Brevibacterium luteolum TaxID=199591 RepID=UPI0038790ACB